MVVSNTYTRAGYGNEVNMAGAAATDVNSVREESPWMEPQDRVEFSRDFQRRMSSAGGSDDWQKARLDAMRNTFRCPHPGVALHFGVPQQARPLPCTGPAFHTAAPSKACAPHPATVTGKISPQVTPSDREKVMRATETRDNDAGELKALKKEYRDIYLEAGRERENAKKAAARGNCTLEDGSRQVVSTLENGNRQVTTLGQDGSRKSVQLNAQYPERVLIEKQGPPRKDARGADIPGETSRVALKGTDIVIGPDWYGSMRGRGSSTSYRLDDQGQVQKIHFFNNEGSQSGMKFTYSRAGKDGRLLTKEEDIKATPEELEEAERGDEFAWIRGHIHQNGNYRDPQGRKIDGAGQKVAVLEGDVDELSGNLGSHAGMVMDIINSKEAGVAPGAQGRFFEAGAYKDTYLLPGFSSFKTPPQEKLIDDNKDALTRELDRAMRFDKRVVPDLERVLDAQKHGGGLSVLNMSYGENPDYYMNQVLSLLSMAEPGKGDRYACPGLRKTLLGDSRMCTPSNETGDEKRARQTEEMKKVAGFVRERMEDPKGSFQQALGEYRKVLSQLADAGVTVVLAAGNGHEEGPRASSSLEKGLPAWDSVSPGASLNFYGRSKDIVTVGASGSRGTPGNYDDDEVAGFSARGEGEKGQNPTLVAPGMKQKSLMKGFLNDGTSMAAPHVAGVIALMKQADPTLRTSDIVDILTKTAARLSQGAAASGAGEVDPEAAVREVLRRAGRPPAAPAGDGVAMPGARKTLDLSLNNGVRQSFDEYLSRNPAMVPKLKQYEAVSGATDRYNCIANSVRDENEVILPRITVNEYDKFYARNGFTPMESLDYSLLDGMEKVVLYGFTPSDGAAYDKIRNANDELPPDYRDPLCYHAIVQEKDGTWSSKMGAHERIRVLDPDELGGGLYGNPVRVYIRKRP